MRVLLLSMLAAALWAQAPSAPAAKPAAAPAKPAAVAAPKPAAPAAAKPAAAAPAKPAAPASPVVLQIGARKVTKAEFDEIMANLPANAKAQLGGDTPEARRRLAEQLTDIFAFSEEARRLKVDQKPAVKVEIFLQNESMLASQLYRHFTEAAKPTEAQLAAYYEEHKGEMESAKARHILIRFQGSRVPLKKDQKDLTDAEALALAKNIREQIVKGEDFAAIAKSASDDTGSGAQGGDLGTFGRGQMVPAFEQAVFSLPIGEVSQPVKSPFGYHIIQVQERGTKKLDEVRAELEKKIQTEKAQQSMEAVKTSAKPVLEESYFGSATPAEPTPVPAAAPAPAKPAAAPAKPAPAPAPAPAKQ